MEDVATHLRVAKESIYRWIDSTSLPAHRVGRLLRFKLSEVDEWVTASGGDDSGDAAPTEELRPKSPRQESPMKMKPMKMKMKKKPMKMKKKPMKKKKRKR
ncbi:MAG TPA: helix-turn-helix domain-containing protein [Gemmatimonadales bacterium]|nr:helix-turn-helix domain-containing protein [Gemmatimonadales bacterium]